MGHKTYTCGVPLCGREATQAVHFYSDTPMLIRGMEATGQEGQHEFFCDQCYDQAGFTSASDIAAIPVGDIEPDYGCNCDDCFVPDCTGECWADAADPPELSAADYAREARLKRLQDAAACALEL